MKEKEMSYATLGSAGLDLLAKECVILNPGEHKSVRVGKIKIPQGMVGFVMPKSGLSHKHDVVARLGVIDSDFGGEVEVRLDNLSNTAHVFNVEDKVAQLVVVPFVHLEGYKIEEVERDGGFGSTGK